MAQSKKSQNNSETMSDLFTVLAKEFGPLLVQAAPEIVHQVVNHAAQQKSTAETGTDPAAGSPDAGNRRSTQEPQERNAARNNENSSEKCEHADQEARQSHAESADEDELNDTADSKQPDDAFADDAADDDDADELVSQSQHRVDSIAVAAMLHPEDVLGAIKDLITEAGEVRKFEAVQETKRADIAACRDIAIANIEVQKQALQLYLEKSFDERKTNFDKLFAVVDHSLETGNMQELALGLQGILTLADSSPFKDLESVEAARAALTDPDHVWNF